MKLSKEELKTKREKLYFELDDIEDNLRRLGDSDERDTLTNRKWEIIKELDKIEDLLDGLKEKKIKLTKEDIQNFATKDEKELLKETGEMGQHDIESGGEWYVSAQELKKAAQHIQKLTKGMLKFKTVRPFDQYQGPYAQCEVLGHWGRLWFAGNDSIDPEYFLETSQHSSNPDDDIAGDVYTISDLLKKLAKEKYGMK